MPRFSRESLKTHYFHVMTQGIDKSYIFDKPEEIKFYIKIMYELLKEHNLKIVAYCIMNNHAHMLINAENTKELSMYMQRLNCKYATYYNKIHNRVGYVFRDRFKSEGIYSERQYYACMKYIYDNPVKAGICSSPEEYPYSNYKKIPKEKIDSSYSFIDIEEEKEKEYIEQIKKIVGQSNITFTKEKGYNNRLEEIVKVLKDKYNLSNRKIAGLLKIGREKVRELYNK